MKILGIMGSPRKKGNTDILLDASLEEAKKSGAAVRKITLGGKAIAPCTACMKCVKTGRCVIDDDMKEIYQGMLESDGIIWATPVYFWSMSAQTKAVIDRGYALTFPKLQLASKVGGLILVARERGCVNTANLFHMYFNYHHMFSTEPAWGYAHNKGDIKNNTQAIHMAGEMARQMVSLVQAGLTFPEEFYTPLRRYVRDKYHV